MWGIQSHSQEQLQYLTFPGSVFDHVFDQVTQNTRALVISMVPILGSLLVLHPELKLEMLWNFKLSLLTTVTVKF